MTDYGVDVSTYPDLDPSGRNITNGRAIAECAARRLTTTPGLLEYTDDDDCIDIRAYLSTATDARDLYRIAGRVERIIIRDERVKAVRAEVITSGDEMTVTAQIDPVTGATFTLVISVNQITVTLLNTLDA